MQLLRRHTKWMSRCCLPPEDAPPYCAVSCRRSLRNWCEWSRGFMNLLSTSIHLCKEVSQSKSVFQFIISSFFFSFIKALSFMRATSIEYRRAKFAKCALFCQDLTVSATSELYLALKKKMWLCARVTKNDNRRQAATLVRTLSFQVCRRMFWFCLFWCILILSRCELWFLCQSPSAYLTTFCCSSTSRIFVPTLSYFLRFLDQISFYHFLMEFRTCHYVEENYLKDWIKYEAINEQDLITPFTDGKFHLLPTGELLIHNLQESDESQSFRCRSMHRLTRQVVVSSPTRLRINCE